jgi:hypothetical protein
MLSAVVVLLAVPATAQAEAWYIQQASPTQVVALDREAVSWAEDLPSFELLALTPAGAGSGSDIRTRIRLNCPARKFQVLGLTLSARVNGEEITSQQTLPSPSWFVIETGSAVASAESLICHGRNDLGHRPLKSLSELRSVVGSASKARP